MEDRIFSRRRFLALAGTALASQLIAVRAQPPAAALAQIGVILPTRTELRPAGAFNQELLGESIRQGALLSEELIRQQEVASGVSFRVQLAGAPNEETALRAANRLGATDDVIALVGGLGPGQARALAGVAAERRIPFLDLGPAEPAYPGSNQDPFTFHLQPDTKQYAAALATWLAAASYRRCCLVQADLPEQESRRELLAAELAVRTGGNLEVKEVQVAAGQLVFSAALQQIREFQPDVLVLLLPAALQLGFLAQHAGNTAVDITAFPDPGTQTRNFYTATLQSSQSGDSNYRLAPWEAGLDDPEAARQLNGRFLGRWGQLMDSSAWAAWAAIKILADSVQATQSLDGGVLRDYLAAPGTAFEVGKSRAVSFRPDDHRLQQALYVVKLDSAAGLGNTPLQQLALASVVAELTD